MNRRNVLAVLVAALTVACGGTGATTFEERITSIATRAGVPDLAAWQACRVDPATAQRVAADVALGGSIGVRRTPTFFVNGSALEGALPAASYRSAIDGARALAMASGLSASQFYATVAPDVVVGDSPALGTSDAWVTVVVFSDFECPYCGAAQATLSTVLPGYGSDVRYVFKNFPLSMHPYAAPTAVAAMCARSQGRFWQFHDLVVADQAALFD